MVEGEGVEEFVPEAGAFVFEALAAEAEGSVEAASVVLRKLSGLRISVIGGLIAGAGNAALAAWLIPRYGVSGAAAALGLSFTLGLAFFLTTRALEGRKA